MARDVRSVETPADAYGDSTARLRHGKENERGRQAHRLAWLEDGHEAAEVRW